MHSNDDQTILKENGVLVEGWRTHM